MGEVISVGIHDFSVYRLIQCGKLKASRVLRGKLPMSRSELLKCGKPNKTL
jgi:hypothetical protein